MNLAKLFVIFGIILIATLGQTEARRRWFKRKYKTFGCADRQKFSSAVRVAPRDNQSVNGDIELSHNTTKRNNRKTNQWHTSSISYNSTETQTNTHSTKGPKKPRRNRRVQCNQSRRWNFNNTASLKRVNSTVNSNTLLTRNPEEQPTRRNHSQKCKGRRARKGKCQRPEPHDNEIYDEEWIDEERSTENVVLHTTEINKIEEPKENIH